MRGASLRCYARDPSLHLENGYARDDAARNSRVTSKVTHAPILMHCSSSRNIPLLQREYGSARVQHADPFRPAPGCRDQSCARGDARAQTASVLTAYGISGLALFGVLAYFFSDFISH